MARRFFNRSTTPLTLTQAGECYVKNSKEDPGTEENLKEEVENINCCKGGVIRISLSDMRATLASVCASGVSAALPEYSDQTVESSSRNVEENVRNGSVDLGIIPLTSWERISETRVLYDEEILLVSGPGIAGTSR